jgi:hypothetical protein
MGTSRAIAVANILSELAFVAIKILRFTKWPDANQP